MHAMKMVSMLALATSAALFGAGCIGSTDDGEEAEDAVDVEQVVAEADAAFAESTGTASQACGWYGPPAGCGGGWGGCGGWRGCGGWGGWGGWGGCGWRRGGCGGCW